MSDDICGVTTTKGEPCQNDPGSCPWHNVEDAPSTGRQSKLNKERQERIASAIEQGKSIVSAARMTGVTPPTVYNWLDRGKDEEETIYAEFFDRFTRAQGIGEDHYFSTIFEMAKEQGDHRFIASLMKQRYPDSWAEKEEGGPGVDTGAETVINIPESVTEKWQR